MTKTGQPKPFPPHQPSFQFYPGDWRKDLAVQSLDYESRGIWWELICFMHESPERGKMIVNDSALTDDEIATCLGIEPSKCKQTLAKLTSKGVASRCQKTGALMCRRMVREQELSIKRAAAGRSGGLARSKQNTEANASSRARAIARSSSTSVITPTAADDISLRSISSGASPDVENSKGGDADEENGSSLDGSSGTDLAWNAALAPHVRELHPDRSMQRRWMAYLGRLVKGGRRSVDECEVMLKGLRMMREADALPGCKAETPVGVGWIQQEATGEAWWSRAVSFYHRNGKPEPSRKKSGPMRIDVRLEQEA